MFLRALLRARGLREELANEIDSKWFHQFQSLWIEPYQRPRAINPDTSGFVTTAQLRAAAFEALKLLTESVKALKIRLHGIKKREQLLGELDVFAAVFKVYWSPQSLSLRKKYEGVLCVGKGVLEVLAQIAPEARPEESPPAPQSDDAMAAGPAQATPEARREAAPPATQPNDPTPDVQASAPEPAALTEDERRKVAWNKLRSERSRRGRKDGYDWDEGFQYLCQLWDERGDPLLPENAVDGWRADADAGRAVQAHLAKPRGKGKGKKPQKPDPQEPDLSNVMKRVSPMLQILRDAHKSA
jgi:hypothetical protein